MHCLHSLMQDVALRIPLSLPLLDDGMQTSANKWKQSQKAQNHSLFTALVDWASTLTHSLTLSLLPHSLSLSLSLSLSVSLCSSHSFASSSFEDFQTSSLASRSNCCGPKLRKLADTGTDMQKSFHHRSSSQRSSFQTMAAEALSSSGGSGCRSQLTWDGGAGTMSFWASDRKMQGK